MVEYRLEIGHTEDIRTCISKATTAFLITLLVILVLNSKHVIVFSSFAASIFLIVAMPTSDASKIRNVVGGHLIGLLSGGIIALFMSSYITNQMFAYAVSVGLATLFMSVCDIMHPPAAGTALGVVINGLSQNVLTSILSSVCIIGIIMYIIQNNSSRKLKKYKKKQII